MVARLVADKLRASLDQIVIVENRPGASTRLALQNVKSAPPDGTTLLATPGAVVYLYPHVFKNLGYDPFKDLSPISKLLTWDYGFAVPAGSPAKTFAEFIQAAKIDSKLAFYGSPSSGSPQHLLGVQMSNLVGVPLQHVWYKGAADVATALIGNSVPSAVLGLGELTQLHQSGQIRILATFGKERSPLLPDVPTMSELGYAELQAVGAVAMYGPAGMRDELKERLSEAVRVALADPEVKEKIAKLGIVATGSTPKELDDFGRSELERWRDVAKISGFIAD